MFCFYSLFGASILGYLLSLKCWKKNHFQKFDLKSRKIVYILSSRRRLEKLEKYLCHLRHINSRSITATVAIDQFEFPKWHANKDL